MQSRIGAVSLAAGLLSALIPVRTAVAQSEEEFNTEVEVITCQLLQDCAGISCENDAFVGDDVEECTYDARAGQDCLDGLQSLGCDGFVEGSLPAACDDVYDCPPCLADDELFEDVGDASRGVVGNTSTLCDHVDTAVDRNPTEHSNEEVPAQPGAGDHTETRGVVAIRTTLDADQLTAAFGNGYYPCGPGINGWTLCATQAALEPGPYFIIVNMLEGDVPRNDPGRIYQYGFVFDADNDESNNYVPSPPFTKDFFLGTDRWYEVRYDVSSGWTLTATDARDGDFLTVQSNARLIVDGNTMTLVVPASELSADLPTFRVTAFCHSGDFGQNPPYDWKGDVEPPVDQPLREVEEVATDPGTGGSAGNGGGGSGGSGGSPASGDGASGCDCQTVSLSAGSTGPTNVLLALIVTLFIWRRRRTRS